MYLKRGAYTTFFLLFMLLLGSASLAQRRGPSEVQIRTEAVAGRVSVLFGQGGNIAVFAGENNTLIVDDQFAPLTDKIVAAISKISIHPVRFVVNTHWHADHTGGNENFGKAGAVIVAHDQVHTRLSRDQFVSFFKKTVKASAPEALPVVTFEDSLSFRFGKEKIRVQFVGPAHTDTDAIVFFEQSNVIHTGDTYFSLRYPFLDVSTGGSIPGLIGALDRILELADAKTRIIPGHGPLSNSAELRKTRNMIDTMRKRIDRAIANGKSDAEIIASKPTADFDSVFGGGFITGDKFVQLICDSQRKILRANAGRPDS